jgi:hypothetical protein
MDGIMRRGPETMKLRKFKDLADTVFRPSKRRRPVSDTPHPDRPKDRSQVIERVGFPESGPLT